MDEADIDISDVDYIAFYENPYTSLKRIYLNLKIPLKDIIKTIKNFKFWGTKRINFERYVKSIYPQYKGKFFYSNHHMSHAASAYFPSGYDDAVILTIDGVGEDTTATISIGTKNKIKQIKEMKYPNSVGLLYTALTTFLGFKASHAL